MLTINNILGRKKMECHNSKEEDEKGRRKEKVTINMNKKRGGK